MIKTIELSPYISVQGLLVSKLPGGQLEIALNGRHYIGSPVVHRNIADAANPRDV